MISCQGIVRSFGTLRALDGVGFSAAPGTVHGILGENGAGKSTLMRILAGLDRPDAGSIAIAGSPVRLATGRAATAAGIGMVHQHFSLVPTFTVIQSCVLGAGVGLGRIAADSWRARIRATAARLGMEIDPDARIADLSVGQRQRVEIIKALLAGGRILILDEPTAVLAPDEADHLLHALRALAASGTTVLFISHKLREIETVCDHLTILRRGRVSYDGRARDADRSAIITAMIGDAAVPESAPPTSEPLSDGRTAPLRIAGAIPGWTEPAQFTVQRGEVLGIAGVDGNGQAELVQAIVQRMPAVQVDAQRLALIPDDRHRDAIAETLSVRENVGLAHRHLPPLSRRGWLRPSAWRQHAARLVRIGEVRSGGADADTIAELPMSALSGGNQQKAVVARELDGDPAVIVAVNPTRGLDVAASAAVLQRLEHARRRGAAVLLIHHDLDELMAHATRIVVLHRGRLLTADRGDRSAIGRLMLTGTC